MNMVDVDQLLADASELGSSAPTARVRAIRDDLARAAVFLSYARHVLSVDLGVIHGMPDSPGDLQGAVDDLPRILAEHSIGGGWSLSADSPVTSAAADQALAGQADELLTTHAAMARVDFGSPDEVATVTEAISHQLAEVADRRDRVEQALRVVQDLVVERYKDGSARVDDWLD